MNNERSLVEIITFLRNFGTECGGNHHKPEFIELTLYHVADELFEKTLKLREAIDKANDEMKKETGIDDDSLFIIRRNKNIRYFKENEK